MIFDETTDSQGRHIICFLLGICGVDKVENRILVKTAFIEDTRSISPIQEIIRTLYEFIGIVFDHKRVSW